MFCGWAHRRHGRGARNALLTLALALEGITLHGLMVLLGLGIYATASHTLRQRRHPSAAIAWVISLVLLPYVALPLYLMIGRRKLVALGRGNALRPGVGLVRAKRFGLERIPA